MGFLNLPCCRHRSCSFCSDETDRGRSCLKGTLSGAFLVGMLLSVTLLMFPSSGSRHSTPSTSTLYLFVARFSHFVAAVLVLSWIHALARHHAAHRT
ncbi:uncharacterized protein BKA78DRAFT_327232 [Phyllosticta capitalensis]|uniref:uncharacterized protein n=1 Tax=Phyllosticta capitalensis TaxID=121624 RepID=UPI00312FB51B